MRWLACIVIGAVVVLCVSGCGKQLLKTRGRVVKNGAPFLPGKDEFVRVTFVPVLDGDKKPEDYYVAEYNRDDGTFRVAGKDLKGMPPGRYRVAVELDRRRSDLLQGKFDAERSPFVYDVDSGTEEIVIDLERPPGKL